MSCTQEWLGGFREGESGDGQAQGEVVDSFETVSWTCHSYNSRESTARQCSALGMMSEFRRRSAPTFLGGNYLELYGCFSAMVKGLKHGCACTVGTPEEACCSPPFSHASPEHQPTTACAVCTLELTKMAAHTLCFYGSPPALPRYNLLDNIFRRNQ